MQPEDFLPPPPAPPADIAQLLVARLPEWTASRRCAMKLDAYGFDDRTRRQALREWEAKVLRELEGRVGDKEARMGMLNVGFQWENLSIALTGEEENWPRAIEAAYLRLFLEHCVQSQAVEAQLQEHLRMILEATDLRRLAQGGEMTAARSMHRHFHMHVGPTNSGKTYSALKALSRAERGAYAGPLRLLAHEVWERMNLGTVGDLGGEGRKCNLLTGEERRIVDPQAGLLSCTVEMVPLNGVAGEAFDVAVIDEIQMMGDSGRGGAWTKAVLGLRAREIHLCGDETTIDLVRKLVEPLGDSITIHRYDRLTPLEVGQKSLEGDFNSVEPGDCVVTFSRSNIFAVKRQIEEKAGKKCAVVYGALPPETRADQAREFNEENGIAEVLVASDAVGMGLNLKIKRIIFESLVKFNGRKEIPLAITQIKQIAGRAGRYGMHTPTTPAAAEDDDDIVEPVQPDLTPQPSGIVTTLHPGDLPLLRQLLPLPLPATPLAVLDIPFYTLQTLASLLPPTTPFSTMLDHLSALCLCPPHTILSDPLQKARIADHLEPYRDRLSLAELETFAMAPINARDQQAMAIMNNVIASYTDEGLVDIHNIFRNSGLLRLLDVCEATLATLPPHPPIFGVGRRPLVPPILISGIPQLETLHKCLVLYIWLSYRLPIAFPQRDPLAVTLKTRTEAVLEQCLERLPGIRQKKTHERGKAVDGKVAEWRREYVNPNGTRKVEGGGDGKKGVEWQEDKIRERLRRKGIWGGVGGLGEWAEGEAGAREEAERRRWREELERL